MSQAQYLACLTYFKQHPRLKKALLKLSSVLPLIIIISYGLFLIFHFSSPQYIFIPALAFIINSLLRHFFNSPRPFEVYHFVPLKAHTKGESFPSRHSTSALIIALTVIGRYPLWGSSLLIISLAIGLTRILCGVHFPKDVIGGYVIALLCASFYLLF